MSPPKKWKKRTRLGIGLGVGLLGAILLGLRYGLRRSARQQIPDDLSPAIFARRLCSTSLGDMVYHTSGAGAPIVFLHGLYPGASSFEWSRVYPNFVLSHSVVAADLIGYGESERPSQALSADDHASSLADLLLEVCSTSPACLVCSGASCAIALLTASRHPERVGHLILLNPVIPRPQAPSAPLGLRIAASIPPLGRFIYDATLAREHSLRAWLLKIGLSNPSKYSDEILRNLLVCAQQPGARHAILHLIRGGLESNVLSRLQHVPHPVTILTKENADSSPDRDPELIASSLPKSRTLKIPACGTLAALEIPDEISSLITPAIQNFPRWENVA